MTEKIKRGLDERLARHVCTLRTASKDDANKEYMTESKLETVHFDKLPKEYSRKKGWQAMPKSNDALYIAEDGFWYFIEFKNGHADRADIYKKIYDSLIILLDWGIIPDVEFSRKHMKYILVYNKDKYPGTQKSEARDKLYSYAFERAGKEEKLFDLGNFEKYLFHETHSYTKELFESEFVRRMEEVERSSSSD